MWRWFSRVRLFVMPWTIARQAPLSIGFSRQEYWSGLPFPSPGDLPDPGIEPRSPVLWADTLLSKPPGKSLYSFLYFLHLLLPWGLWRNKVGEVGNVREPGKPDLPRESYIFTVK